MYIYIYIKDALALTVFHSCDNREIISTSVHPQDKTLPSKTQEHNGSTALCIRIYIFNFGSKTLTYQEVLLVSPLFHAVFCRTPDRQDTVPATV